MKFNRGQILANLVCQIPFYLFIIDLFLRNLTANPIQAITLRSGRTSINLLLFTLMCTPLNNLFGLSSFIQIRKITGLYSLFYAVLHFLVFTVIDFELKINWIIEEIRYKPFLQIGLGSLTILIILGLTSIRSIKNKTKKLWKPIQRLIYIAAGLSILHNFLAAKGNITLPVIQMVFFILLMLIRLKPFSSRLLFKFKIFDKINQCLLTG